MKITLLDYLRSLGLDVKGCCQHATPPQAIVDVKLTVDGAGFPTLPENAAKWPRKDLIDLIREYLGIHYRERLKDFA